MFSFFRGCRWDFHANRPLIGPDWSLALILILFTPTMGQNLQRAICDFVTEKQIEIGYTKATKKTKEIKKYVNKYKQKQYK